MDLLTGVLAQPTRLEAAQDDLRHHLVEAHGARLRGTTVALVGMGASLYASLAAVHDLRGRGIRSFVVSATDLCDESVDAADTYIAVSASGRSRETVEAMMRLPSGYRIGVSQNSESPLRDAVDTLIPTFGGEDTSPCTVSYVATLQAIGLLAAQAGGTPTATGWRQVPSLVQQVLDSAQGPVEVAAVAFAEASSIDFVGRGASHGSAGEAALLLREKARISTAVFDTLNYLHGPMESQESGHGLVIFGDDREVSIAQDVASFGCDTLLVTRRRDVTTRKKLTVLQLPKGPGQLADAVVEIIPLQLLVAQLARERGLYDLAFRHQQTGTKIET